jgi:ATP-dependent exoDNAse (exonuclease V) alpha subunit
MAEYIAGDDGTNSTSKSPEDVLPFAADDPPEELTPGQTDAWQEVLMRLSQEQMASLLGAAGTGKTFLLTRIAGRLEEMGLKVLAVAPTHQAVGQIEKLFSGDSITVNTIQSALGLQLQRDHKGDYELVPSGESDVGEFDLVIADEASMIGRELWTHTKAAARGSGPKILFVGDPYQLPPVSEAASPALEQHGAKLTGIVRQQQGNPIIELATQIREDPSRGFYPLPEETKTDGDLGIYEVRQYKATEKAARAFEKNPTGTRVLTWRNDTAAKWNRRIRRALYPSEERFAEGMHLLAQEAYNPGEFIKFHTSALLKVEAVRKTTSQLGDNGPSIPVWSLDLVEEASRQPHTDVLVTRGQGQQTLEEYTDAMAEQQNWSEYYQVKEAVASLEFSAAGTTHSAQGTTLDTAFIDTADIEACYGDEAQALKYVALTRASDVLVLIR